MTKKGSNLRIRPWCNRCSMRGIKVLLWAGAGNLVVIKVAKGRVSLQVTIQHTLESLTCIAESKQHPKELP